MGFQDTHTELAAERWAAEQLGVPEGQAKPADVYRLLANERFRPSEAQRQAIDFLFPRPGTEAKVPQTFEDERDAEHRQAIDEFAAGFFDLPPESRRKRFEELSAEVSVAMYVQRLLPLEPGLDIEVGPFGGGTADRIAFLVRDLFVMRPRERAIRQRKELIRIREAGIEGEWQRAAAEVQKKQPETAVLVPEFFEAIDRSSQSISKRDQRAIEKTVRAAPLPTYSEEEKSRWWIAIPIAMVVIAIVRGIEDPSPTDPLVRDYSLRRPDPPRFDLSPRSELRQTPDEDWWDDYLGAYTWRYELELETFLRHGAGPIWRSIESWWEDYLVSEAQQALLLRGYRPWNRLFDNLNKPPAKD